MGRLRTCWIGLLATGALVAEEAPGGTGLGAFLAQAAFGESNFYRTGGSLEASWRLHPQRAVEGRLRAGLLALGSLVTALLVAASGNPAAAPALSVLVSQLPADNPVRLGAEAVNFFHLWSTLVLAAGLARLAQTSFKEAAFWVFSYWVAARFMMLLLA